MAILEGDLTSSDHLPIVVKLSTNPIVKEHRTRRDFKNANWEGIETYLRDRVKEQEEEIPMEGRVDKHRIDEAINKWTNSITDAIDQFVPKKKIIYYKHPKTSDYLRLLELAYETIRHKHHYTIADRQTIRDLQRNLNEEAKRFHRESWSEAIEKLQEKDNDPTAFWKGVKRMMGSKIKQTPYIYDSRGNKIYEDIEKETKFREIWENIFRITDEENNQFDRQ